MSTAEEFAMPMDLSPEHAAPVEVTVPASQSTAALETLEAPAQESIATAEPIAPQPLEEASDAAEKIHNGIVYTGLVPPDFTRVMLAVDIQDDDCLVEPIEMGSTFEIVKFDGGDSTVAIKPHGCKTVDGLYWLQPEEFEVVVDSPEEAASEVAAEEVRPGECTPAAAPAADTSDNSNAAEGLTRSQQLRFQHHEQIIKKQREVDSLLEVWEDAKNDAKRAKEDYESAVDELQKLIRTPPMQQSLFSSSPASDSASAFSASVSSRIDDSLADQDEEVDQDEDEPQAEQPAVNQPTGDPEAWRKTPLSDLQVYGLSPAIVKKFAEGGIHTLGDASDYQMGEHGRALTDLKGIGQAKVDKFEEAAACWHRDNPMPSAEVSDTADAAEPVEAADAASEENAEDAADAAEESQDESTPLNSLLDHEFTQAMCDRFWTLGILTVANAESLLADPQRINLIHAKAQLAPGDIDVLRKVIDGYNRRAAEFA